MRSFPWSSPVPAGVELHFRRGGHPGQGLRRKVGLRFYQALLCVLLQAALFTGLQRLCLFLLDWDHLRLNRIEVIPEESQVKDKVEKAASHFRSASLLALDTSPLASELETLPWIKEARIRKVFPSTLRIEVMVRTPMAVLDRGALFLVDEEGVLLGQAEEGAPSQWPLLSDRGEFQEDYQAKIALGRSCLSGLPAELRARIERIDLSDVGCLSLKLRDDPAELILGRDGFAVKLNIYNRQAAHWAAFFGRLKTVDLRIADRAYVRLAAGAARPHPAAGRGEVM